MLRLLWLVRAKATGALRYAVSDDAGGFEIANLIPGDYSVEDSGGGREARNPLREWSSTERAHANRPDAHDARAAVRLGVGMSADAARTSACATSAS